MISQLNDHMIDIQYKSDKLIERKTLEFNQQSNSLLMEIEDYYTKLINKHLQIDHLNKVIQLKEDDETLKNQELFVTKFTVKVLEGQNEEINEKLEELEMRYDELITLYENLEPSLIKFQKENKKLKRQNENNEKEMMALKLIETKYFELKYKVTKESAVQTVEEFHSQIPQSHPRKPPKINESNNKVISHNEIRAEDNVIDETHPLIKSKHINQSKGLIKNIQNDKDEVEQKLNGIPNPSHLLKNAKIEQISENHQANEASNIKHVEELKQDLPLTPNSKNYDQHEAIIEEQSNRSQSNSQESHLPSVFDLKEHKSEGGFEHQNSFEFTDSRLDSAMNQYKEKISSLKVVVDRSKIKPPTSKAKVDIKNLIKVMASK